MTGDVGEVFNELKLQRMIEFKDGKKFLQVKRDRHSPPHEALVKFCENGFQSSGIYISKEMYNLLEQAMPHIKAIVEGEE